MVGIILLIVGLAVVALGVYLALINTKKGSGDIIGEIGRIPMDFNPDMNRFAKGAVIKSAAQDTEMANALTEKAKALTAMLQAQTTAIMEQFNYQTAQMRATMLFNEEASRHRLTLLTHERDMALVENDRMVMGEANRLGLPASVLTELRLEEGKTKLRLFEAEQTARAELSAADFSDLAPYQQIDILSQRLENLRRQRYQLSIGYDPPEVKDPLLARYDKNIKALEQDINARQKRLVQAQKR